MGYVLYSSALAVAARSFSGHPYWLYPCRNDDSAPDSEPLLELARSLHSAFLMSPRILTVLIIDENIVRAAILEEGLRDYGEIRIHHIRDMSELLPRVAAIDPDVILIDLENPSRDTLEQMFQVSRWAERPIAMFVDKSDADSVQAAIDAGVSAYVVDGLRRERVKPLLDITISRFHAFHRLQQQLSEARTELEDRRIIERAKRILNEQNGLTEDAAYSLLRRTAMDQSRKIVDIARALVTASELLNRRANS